MMRRLSNLLVVVCLFALPAGAATSTCPDIGALKNFLTADNVAATFSNSGNTSTYQFISLTNENPVNGVPGLVKYCVYPNPIGQPVTITPEAEVGTFNWGYAVDPSDFAFLRPSGNKSDISLNGTSTEIGKALWSTVPANQTILLHINDPAKCASLYGGTAPTCFVKPSLGPVCDAGDGATSAAYNAIPFGGVNCSPPSLGFEADGVAEFGDQVTLAGTARTLDSLKVLFASWGCESGHWNTGDCATTPGLTFMHPITANIYDSVNCTGTPVVCGGTPLATVTTNQTIPYRPSADNLKCTGADAGKWFNPQNGPAGACQNSIATVLTFDFSSQNITLPQSGGVVWTVAYNTSRSGYHPIAIPLGPGDSTCPSGGCGYDSLNVGVMSYPNAPYAGIDVSADVVWFSYYAGSGIPTNYPPPFGSGVLTPSSGVASSTTTPQNPPETWGTGYRPLGEIITKP